MTFVGFFLGVLGVALSPFLILLFWVWLWPDAAKRYETLIDQARRPGGRPS